MTLMMVTNYESCCLHMYPISYLRELFKKSIDPKASSFMASAAAPVNWAKQQREMTKDLAKRPQHFNATSCNIRDL